MTTMVGHLSNEELEACYEAAADPVAKSHFHALWLLSCGYEVEEVGGNFTWSNASLDVIRGGLSYKF